MRRLDNYRHWLYVRALNAMDDAAFRDGIDQVVIGLWWFGKLMVVELLLSPITMPMYVKRRWFDAHQS